MDIDSQLVHTRLDSGISTATKSDDSIGRVKEWLDVNGADSNAKNANNQPTELDATICMPVKTDVAYYLPGEKEPYISHFYGKRLSLAEFKRLITKKGNFRYIKFFFNFKMI